MKSTLTSQLDKFAARQAKKSSDTESLLRAELERKQKQLDQIRIMNGESELKEKGGIQEAAAVFSYAGMEIFATMFGNSIRQVIIEEAPAIIREVLREEIRGFVKGMIKGYEMRLRDDIQSLVTELSPADLIMSADTTERDSVRKEESPKVQRVLRQKKVYTRSNKTDSVLVAEKLKENGPMKLKEIREALPEVEFGVNPYSKMRGVLQQNPAIRSMGNGIYMYVEEGAEQDENSQ